MGPARSADMTKPSDVSSPLKSVAENLSAILKNCKVQPISLIPPYPQRSQLSHQLTTYREQIEPLLPRAERLAQSMSTPVPEGEFWEEERRKVLKR